MKRINAGKYRHEIAIHYLETWFATPERDDAGQVAAKGNLITVHYAEVKCISSGEISHGKTADREDVFEVRVRGDLTAVNSENWIVFNGRRLDIRGAINVDGLGLETLFTCVARGQPKRGSS